jgi:hypothetical protein
VLVRVQFFCQSGANASAGPGDKIMRQIIVAL